MRRTGVSSALALALLCTPAGAQTIWTGAQNKNWNNPANWSTGAVPLATDDVVIPNVGFNPPSQYIADPVCRDLFISGAGTMTLASGFDLQVNGALDLNGLLTASANSSITVVEDWVNDGGFVHGDSEVILAGSGSLSGTSTTTFGDLTVSAGIRSATVSFAVDGAVSVLAGATLGLSGTVTATVEGDWDSSDDTAVVTGGGTVQLNGTGVLVTGSAGIPNLWVSGGLRTVEGATVVGDLGQTAGVIEIQDNTTLAVQGSAVMFGGALSFIEGGVEPEILDVEGSMTLNGTAAGAFGASSQIQCAGDWVAGAPFTPTSGIVRLDGGTTASVTGLVPTFASLRIVSGTKTLQSGAILSGDLRVDDGATLVAAGAVDVEGFVRLGDASSSWDLGGLTHDVGSEYTALGGSSTNGRLRLDGAGGPFDTGSGSVDELEVSSGAWSVTGALVLGDLTQVGGDVTVEASATAAVAGAATLSGGTLGLGAGALLEVGGNVDVSGLTAGAMDAGARIGFASDWTGSASWAPAEGLVVHNSAAPSVISGDAHFPSLQNELGVLSVSGPLTVAGDLTLDEVMISGADSSVAGKVTLANGADWDLGGGVHTVGGDWFSSGGSATGGAVRFDGDGDLDTGAASIDFMQVVAGVRRVQTSVVAQDLEVTGGTLRVLNDQTFTVQGNATFSGGFISWFPTALDDDEVLLVEGDVICNVPIEFESTGSVLRCRGNWSSDASFAPTIVTVELDGPAPTLVVGGAAVPPPGAVGR